MMDKVYDVIIVGAGMVGLSLAKSLADNNMQVAVVESQLPRLEWADHQYDSRVSAVNQSSMRFLQELKVSSSLREKYYTPLREMQVWDSLGGGKIHFDCADIGLSELGYIIENREIVRVLWQQLQNMSNVSLFCPELPEAITKTESDITVTLQSGFSIKALLAIGADGAHSWLREQMQVPMTTRSYQHHALVAVIQTEKSLENTAWQNFMPKGPLGVLPLAHPHHAAIVWSTEPSHAEKLMTMTAEPFNRALTNALDSRLGKMELLSERHVIPLMMRHVQNYVIERMALVGDAAHTIHPLAGQGVNLGFMDAEKLSQYLCVARKQQRDIGSLRVLRCYERARKGDNQMMLDMMSGLKNIFSSTTPVLVQLRTQGVGVVDRVGLLKHFFMRRAVGS